jgi:hypothetical protein
MRAYITPSTKWDKLIPIQWKFVLSFGTIIHFSAYVPAIPLEYQKHKANQYENYQIFSTRCFSIIRQHESPSTNGRCQQTNNYLRSWGMG